MAESIGRLPIHDYVNEIIASLNHNNIIVIGGGTGCGKSTQVAQIILNASIASKIVVTQPRRIAAIALAERVAKERNVTIGSDVGYMIKGHNVTSQWTSIIFETGYVSYYYYHSIISHFEFGWFGYLSFLLFSGHLLTRLSKQRDEVLGSTTHFILDEVHERDQSTDLLMKVLKDECLRNRNLKLILMSATLDTSKISQYFDDCPIIEIPGKNFEVDEIFLETILIETNYKIEEGE